MIIVLSPSKTLDTTSRATWSGLTQPDYLEQSEILVNRLRKFSRPRLAGLMNISAQLAAENHDRFQKWNRPFTPENAVPALQMFQGDVYEGLKADSFSAADRNFAQKHLRILSGLYGLVRPLDLLQPYRLEMGTTFETGKPKSLYDFWGDQLAEEIKKLAAKSKPPLLINLASNEYFKALKPKTLDVQIITPNFKEQRPDGTTRMVTYFAKKARGTMARHLIQSRAKSLDDLLEFQLDGYSWNQSESTPEKPVFTRPERVKS